MKVKYNLKFEKLNLNINVFELNKTVLTPVHISRNYHQPWIEMLLYENYFCITPQLHTLINKDSHKKQVC